MPVENLQDAPEFLRVSCIECSSEYDLLAGAALVTISRGWGFVEDARIVTHQISDGYLICSDCIRSCEDCGDIFERDFVGMICESCQYDECGRCGYQVTRGALRTIPEIAEAYCDTCHAEWVRENSRLIQNYSFKPAPSFFKLKKENTKTFFGLELEIESTSNISLEKNAKIIQDHLGQLAYFKFDGSLNDGFEIVTHPFSFEWYKQNFKFDFLRDLRANGFRSWDTQTCGLHIHISKNAFVNNAHVWKFCQLFLKNKSSWVKMAGRSSTRWASYDPDRLPVADILKHKKHPERYCAVNLCNAETIEIRIFRGSLNPVRVQSAIESVAAGFDYSRMINVKDYARDAIDFANFAKFVEIYGDEYPNSLEVMKKKGLI